MQILIWGVWGCSCESAFLMNSQELLMVQVCGPYLE